MSTLKNEILSLCGCVAGIRKKIGELQDKVNNCECGPPPDLCADIECQPGGICQEGTCNCMFTEQELSNPDNYTCDEDGETVIFQTPTSGPITLTLTPFGLKVIATMGANTTGGGTGSSTSSVEDCNDGEMFVTCGEGENAISVCVANPCYENCDLTAITIVKQTVPSDVVFQVGDTIDYQVIITNNTGCDLTDLVFTDSLVADVEFDGNLPQGETIISYSAEAMTETVTNTATLTGEGINIEDTLVITAEEIDPCEDVECLENETCLGGTCICMDENACNSGEPGPCTYADTDNCLDCDGDTICLENETCLEGECCAPVLEVTVSEAEIIKQVIAIPTPQCTESSVEFIDNPRFMVQNSFYDGLWLQDCQNTSSSFMGNCPEGPCNDYIASNIPVGYDVDECMGGNASLQASNIITDYIENQVLDYNSAYSYGICDSGSGTGYKVEVLDANGNILDFIPNPNEVFQYAGAYDAVYCFRPTDWEGMTCGEYTLRFRFSSHFCDNYVDYIVKEVSFTVSNCPVDPDAPVIYGVGDTLCHTVSITNTAGCDAEITSITDSMADLTQVENLPTTILAGETITFDYCYIPGVDLPIESILTIEGNFETLTVTTITD